MRIISANPAVNFSSNSIGLGGVPVDNTADQSLCFSGVGGVLSVTGQNVVNASAVGSGITVGGGAVYAALQNITAFGYDTGSVPGPAGFTFAALMQQPTLAGAGYGQLCTDTTTSEGYGFYYIEPNISFGTMTSASAGGIRNASSFLQALWQMFVYDISPAGVITIYEGYNGSLSQTAQLNQGNYFDPGAKTFKVGLAGFNGVSANIAQFNLYKGTNRPSLAALQALYSKWALYYNGRLSNNI